MILILYKKKLIKIILFLFMLISTYKLLAIVKKEEKKIVSTMQNKSFDTNLNKDTKIKIQSEQSQLELENALYRARLEKKLSINIAQIESLRIEKERQRLEKDIEDENTRREHDKCMLLLQIKKEKLKMELELSQVNFMKQMEQYNIQLVKLDKKIQLEKFQTQLIKETTYRLQAEIEALEAKKLRNKSIEKKPIYLKDPLNKKNNTLVLSDRCIELNGLITPCKANYIVNQIQYFNNKNIEYPIFLIINYSPGGYASAGWNILQAIEYSQAPVYVVVKSFAASMAAVITTLATKSYAYPNAEILHHQPSSWFFNGNVRATKDQYKELNETWKRLGGRVAKKMGISLKDFNKKLYEKSIYGDWIEYGDNAKKLKWIDHVIYYIQDSAMHTLQNVVDYSLDKFIKKYSNSDEIKNIELSELAMYYNIQSPNDFNYSYIPNNIKSKQMIISSQSSVK